jgi:hypothetical protein
MVEDIRMNNNKNHIEVTLMEMVEEVHRIGVHE